MLNGSRSHRSKTSGEDSEVAKFIRYLQSNGQMEKLGTSHENRKQAIHRWFSFTPGFSHLFVRTALEFFGLKGMEYRVFDPFMGSATTGVVGIELGVNVVGNESHKFLYKVGKAKTHIIRKPEVLTEVTEDALMYARNKWRSKRVEEENPLLLRCYSKNNLKKLATLRDVCMSQAVPAALKPFVLVGISALLPRCSVVPISVPYVSWTHTRIAAEPFHLFELIMHTIKKDLLWMRNRSPLGRSTIYHHDSRIRNGRIESSTVDFTFTSPPYLNNLDYGEALKVYTYFWGYAKDWGEVTKKIRNKSVTSATTHYRRGDFDSRAPEKILGNQMLKHAPETSKTIVQKMKLIGSAGRRKQSKKSFDLMTGLYFRDMFQVLQEMHRVLKDDSLSIVVIGDCAPHGVRVPTDEILGDLAVEWGFSDYWLKTLRVRGRKWSNLRYRHKKRLRESLLVLRK